MEHQLEVAPSHRPNPDQSKRLADSWEHTPRIRHLIVSTLGYQKLKTRVSSCSRISCLALAEKIWEIFHGHNPHTQLCYSSHKCMFITSVTPFKREINWLSNDIRLLQQRNNLPTRIYLLFLISLFLYLSNWYCNNKLINLLFED